MHIVSFYCPIFFTFSLFCGIIIYIYKKRQGGYKKMTSKELRDLWVFLNENNAPINLKKAVAKEIQLLQDPRNKVTMCFVPEDEKLIEETLEFLLSVK